MNERIKLLRKQLGLTQEDFSKKIGSARNTIAQYETGRGEPSNIVISSICREFNVNEIWLRTGEGEMFQKMSDMEELTLWFSRITKGKNMTDQFKVAFIQMLSGLSDDEWSILADKAEELQKICNKMKEEP